MSIVRTTAYPSRYANLPPLVTDTINENLMAGKFYLCFDTNKRGWLSLNGTARKRELAQLIGRTLGVTATYDRSDQSYSVASWRVFSGNYAEETSVTSPLFSAEKSSEILTVLEQLARNEYVPVEGLTICFKPDVYELQTVLNLCNIIEARSALITQALGLKEEIQIIIDEDLAFGISLDAFLFLQIEACIYLLKQSYGQAVAIGKARMKPCDGSNPKFQMRSWLLRLGFIGEAFARPRQTLLEGLEGDMAFFNDDGKQKAVAKRKSQRLVG